MTMTRLPVGCIGGMVGVAAPLNTRNAQDTRRADALGGSAKAAVVLAPTTVDAAAYTPAAALGTGVNDVEDGHGTRSPEGESCMRDVAVLSSQENWAAGRMNPFGKLLDMLVPVRDWLADLIAPQSMESALVFAQADMGQMQVPVSLQKELADQTTTDPTAVKPKLGSGSNQSGGQSSKPEPKKKGQSVPRWKLVLAMTAGRR